jgi:hypothetical protein
VLGSSATALGRRAAKGVRVRSSASSSGDSRGQCAAHAIADATRRGGAATFFANARAMCSGVPALSRGRDGCAGAPARDASDSPVLGFERARAQNRIKRLGPVTTRTDFHPATVGLSRSSRTPQAVPRRGQGRAGGVTSDP